MPVTLRLRPEDGLTPGGSTDRFNIVLSEPESKSTRKRRSHVVRCIFLTTA